MKKVLFFLFFLSVLLIGCAGSHSEGKNLKLDIINRQINSWVNLMPGSKPSFFISGSLTIENNEHSVIDSIKLLKCEVLQEGKRLYELHPELSSSVSNMEQMNPGNDRIYNLYLPHGTPVLKELNFEKPISIAIYLSALSKVKQYEIDSIFVIKTY